MRKSYTTSPASKERSDLIMNSEPAVTYPAHSFIHHQADSPVNILSKIYTINDYGKVSKFLLDHDAICEDLYYLYFEVKKSFEYGLESVYLDVISDIDDPSHEDLFVIILTSFEVEKAMEIYREIEMTYLNKVLHQNKFSFHVDIEYV